MTGRDVVNLCCVVVMVVALIVAVGLMVVSVTQQDMRRDCVARDGVVMVGADGGWTCVGRAP